MFCPQCGAEYRQGVSECVDCEVALTAEVPAEPDHPEPDLVKLVEISDPAVLPVIIGLLESAGIESLVEGDEVLGMLPVGRFWPGGWDGKGRGLSAVIRVPRGRVEEARALLAHTEEPGDDTGE